MIHTPDGFHAPDSLPGCFSPPVWYPTDMQPSALRLGFLIDGEPNDEETAALSFARGVVDDVESVPLREVASGTVTLDRFDALWWHAHAPVGDPHAVAACRDPIGAYIADGGGLWCSARALAQVAALGIDPVPPDATGTEQVIEAVGPLWKAVYADHPALDGLDGLRHHIRPPGSDGPYVRYERVLPERADVLAATYRGNADVPTEPAVLQWRIGSGTVLGVGVGMEFAQPDEPDTEATRERFAANVIRWLAGDADHETALATGRPKTAPELLRYRDALADDPNRPRYHLTPPANWLNDPNGLIHHDDTYHLFYQYNPGGPYHHTVHWGHAVSDDLVHWRDRPVAMTPDPSGPDRDGCWSGCAVAVDGDVYALYTGGRDGWQRPCLARATDDDLTAFEQVDDNPVIDAPPPALDLLSTPGEPAHFRDHCLVREDGRWHQLIGAGLQDYGGVVVSYTGTDLTEWTYAGPTLVADEVEPGVVWECPELLRYPDGDLLHVSDYAHVRYFIGEFDADESRFVPDSRGTLDPGAFYAPQSLTTPDGREVMIGWLREERPVPEQWEAGWAGAMSLPREVAVVGGELRQRPVREVERLRRERLHEGTLTLDDAARRLPVEGTGLECRLRVDPTHATEVGLVLRASPDGPESTSVRIRPDRVVVDRTESSVDPAAHADDVAVDVADLSRPFDIRVFLDGSVLELFVNDRRALSTRIYPTRPDATGVGLYAGPGGATIDLDIWRLGSAWPALSNRAALTGPSR